MPPAGVCRKLNPYEESVNMGERKPHIRTNGGGVGIPAGGASDKKRKNSVNYTLHMVFPRKFLT